MSTPTRRILLSATFMVACSLFLFAQEATPEEQLFALQDKAREANDKGDLVAVKQAYEEILKINDKDVGAREGLARVEAALADAAAKAAPAPEAPVTATATEPAPSPVPAAPATLIDQVTREREALYSEVESAIAEAEALAASGQYDKALRLLEEAGRALPNNTSAKVYRDKVLLARQDVIGARDAGGDEVERLANQRLRDVARRNQEKIDVVEARISEARSLVRKGGLENLDLADATLDAANKDRPRNISTEPLDEEIKDIRKLIVSERINRAIEARELAKVPPLLEKYMSYTKAGKDDITYLRLKSLYLARKADPSYRGIDEISPGLKAKDDKVQELLVKGRAKYLYGDYQGALDTYREVLQYQPSNTEAKAYQVRIRKLLSDNSGQWNRGLTKGKLLELLDESWKLPEVYNREQTAVDKVSLDPVLQKLKEITVPEINIKDLPLNRALEQLVIVSQAYDKDQKGVNIVPIDPEKRNPSVNITLRNVTLDRALEFVVKQVNFTYTVNDGIIEVRPDSGSSDLETDFFPLPDAAVTKMTGISQSNANAGGGGASPFSGGGGAGPAGDTGASPREVAIRNFFTRSGVSFEVQGASLAWDGAILTATQTRKNLDRIRNILRRYSDTKQVHIESKFIEVNESTLNELSANWQLSKTVGNSTVIRARTGLRGINEAFGSSSVANPGKILNSTTSQDNLGNTVTTTSTFEIPNSPPAINRGNFGTPDYNFGGSGLAGMVGTIGSYDLTVFLRAIEQNNGSDLMSAPSLTVVDGKTATIRIVQTLRYPDSYGDVQSNVGQAGGNNQNGGGAAGVTITAGTPQDFKEQDVGVTLEVTPTVQQDDSIALNLKPHVVEFEGFVEYGGTSVAIQGNTTVTVPSGFFQPIFSHREVTTDVTIFDGATVVIGGLTREEVKTVNDKVPVLGDIPLLGAAFRSNGKTTTKRNLMVFVTANLISPGGSPLRSKLPGVNNGSTFSNPVVVTPGGAVYREVTEAAKTEGAKPASDK